VLADLAARLRPGSGRLLIQVPYFVENPFELLVTDHSSHFTPATLGGLLARSGLHPEQLTTQWIAKELSAVCHPDGTSAGTAEAPESPGDRLARAVEWLQAVERAAVEEARQSGAVGIFGTSISGTWLAGCLDDQVSFFVDEDPGRVGREHLGRAILDPGSVPADAPVYVPLPPKLTGPLRARLDSGPGRYLFPPPLET
jgi:hypothetical protein